MRIKVGFPLSVSRDRASRGMLMIMWTMTIRIQGTWVITSLLSILVLFQETEMLLLKFIIALFHVHQLTNLRYAVESQVLTIHEVMHFFLKPFPKLFYNMY